MAESKEFRAWHKLHCARLLGQITDIEKTVDEQMKEINLKLEYGK